MSKSALYLGENCPPNMEAYIDSLLFRTEQSFSLLVTTHCTVPHWIHEQDRIEVLSFPAPTRFGLGRTRTARNIVAAHLKTNRPTEIRQITQPRWHAPGVLLGTRGISGVRSGTIPVSTRVSASMFSEFRKAPSPLRAWVANNCIGRTALFADRLFTPKYGRVSLPWWSSAELVVESRTVNTERFHPAAEPKDGVFEGTQRRVLTVGRISRRKGIDLVLATADQLRDWEFTFVGPISDEGLAETARATPNVNLLDPVEYIEMPGVYGASDVVLSASRLEWGGVSRAMLEGKATGRPVVALNRGDAPSVADVTVDADSNAIVDALQTVSE